MGTQSPHWWNKFLAGGRRSLGSQTYWFYWWLPALMAMGNNSTQENFWLWVLFGGNFLFLLIKITCASHGKVGRYKLA